MILGFTSKILFLTFDLSEAINSDSMLSYNGFIDGVFTLVIKEYIMASLEINFSTTCTQDMSDTLKKQVLEKLKSQEFIFHVVLIMTNNVNIVYLIIC